MNAPRRTTPSRILPRALACALALCMAPTASAAVDWSKAKEKEVVLFYPGQASWEWVMTQADHSGATKFRGGKNCRGCHDGEQADIGAAIAFIASIRS